MARLASVSLQNSRPSLTPMVSISVIVCSPGRKRPPHAGLVTRPLLLISTVITIHAAQSLSVHFKVYLKWCFTLRPHV